MDTFAWRYKGTKIRPENATWQFTSKHHPADAVLEIITKTRIHVCVRVGSGRRVAENNNSSPQLTHPKARWLDLKAFRHSAEPDGISDRKNTPIIFQAFNNNRLIFVVGVERQARVTF